MVLVFIIDIIVVVGLVTITLTKGTEKALPFLVFCLVLLPREATIPLPWFDLTVHRIAIVAFTVLWLLYGRRRDATAGKRPVALGYLIVLQLLWSFLATVNSPVFMISLKSTVSWGLDIFLLYYLLLKTVSRTKTVHSILAAMFAAMFVCSILGYCETYYEWNVVSYLPLQKYRFSVFHDNGLLVDLARGIRARATFPHAILFGTALSMAIPLGLYLLTRATARWQKLCLWVGIALMFLNIYKTMSRGPWLALIISLALMLVLSTSTTRRRLFCILLISLAVLIIRPGVWDTVANTYEVTLDPHDNSGRYDSYQWRYILLRVANETVGKSVDRLLWGYGPESFYYLGLQTQIDGKTVKVESCDSSVAALIVEIGYVGFLITVVLVIKPAVVVLREFRQLSTEYNQLSLLVFVNIVAFSFMMTNVGLWGWGQQNYMLWIPIAAGMLYRDLLQSEARISRRKDLANPVGEELLFEGWQGREVEMCQPPSSGVGG